MLKSNETCLRCTLKQEIFAVLRLRSEIGEIKMPPKILFQLNHKIKMPRNIVSELNRQIKMLRKKLDLLK